MKFPSSVLKSVAAVALSLACGSFTMLHAQTVGVKAQITPSNSSQCVQFNSGLTPNLQFHDTSNVATQTPQAGFCIVTVNLPQAIPNFITSCTVETGNSAGYLYSPQIVANSQSNTSFQLLVSYYVNNTQSYMPSNAGSGALSLGNGYYIYATGAGNNNGTGTPYTLLDLGTQQVDCIAVAT